MVLVLIIIIVASFAMQLVLSKPHVYSVLKGMLVLKLDIITIPKKLYVAISILGATIMPHSLYLHSSMVLTRQHELTIEGKKEAIYFNQVDCWISLTSAFFVNAAILIVAAATFYRNDFVNVADLYEAYRLLDPLLGTRFASVAFGVALLAAGLNSTLTGTMAGQIVMEGFMNWTLAPTYRRILTRSIAIVPAMVVILIGGEEASNDLLLFSQVVLSFTLPFAVFPLVHLTSDASVMGQDFVNSSANSILAYFFAALITFLNLVLVFLYCNDSNSI